ncbi:MAG: hypothetical protein L0241_07135 [Planctomycetia bacterium]|nr:hypothetical protein [Planctomycetia bacterium]
MNTFERDGISFRYSENWSLETEDDADTGGWAVTVTSPETGFLMVSLRPDATHPGDLSDQALDTLKSEYKELDAENVTETIAGQPALGFDASFLTLDTVITCRVRALDTFAGPLLLMAQVSEYDRETNDPILRTIIASLNVDTD